MPVHGCAGGREDAGVGGAIPRFLPCFYSLPGDFPEWSWGQSPAGPFLAVGVWRRRSRAEREERPLPAQRLLQIWERGKDGTARSRESPRVGWDPVLCKELRLFCGNSPLAFGVLCQRGIWLLELALLSNRVQPRTLIQSALLP